MTEYGGDLSRALSIIKLAGSICQSTVAPQYCSRNWMISKGQNRPI